MQPGKPDSQTARQMKYGNLPGIWARSQDGVENPSGAHVNIQHCKTWRSDGGGEGCRQ